MIWLCVSFWWFPFWWFSICWSSIWWISGGLLALIWLAATVPLARHISEIADLTQPEWELPRDTQLPSLMIVVPARNEEEEIESAIRSLLQLDYPQFEV